MMNRQPYNPCRFNRSRGFSLMEILVTVIVMSIGLLGLAGLQLSSLKYNHSAYQRSQAAFMANDIIDRMRANRAIARAGNYDIAIGAVAPAAPGNCNGSVADTCTPADMATYDVSDWKQRLATIFPGGDGSIGRVAGAGDQILATVIIQWDDSRGEEAAIQLPMESLI
jgi:type IV pilus assembly protein PilV